MPNANGKRPVVFDRRQGFADLPVELPCGQCIGCRLERSRQWAVRCVHESQMWDRNCFITLTYDEAHLPEDRSVDVRHFQLFMKKLRKRYGAGIRFFHCGEYGTQNQRPHYHAIIFNHDFEDKKLWKIVNDNPLYVSPSLEGLWEQGFCSVGAVTFASAAYVARYIMTKWTGPEAQSKYQWIDPTTGEVHQRRPEYITMSRGRKAPGGIGAAWLAKYAGDLRRGDRVVLNGAEMKPPRYYDEQMQLLDEAHMKTARRTRVREARKHAADQTKERLAVREKVQEARLSRLPRTLGKDKK